MGIWKLMFVSYLQFLEVEIVYGLKIKIITYTLTFIIQWLQLDFEVKGKLYEI